MILARNLAVFALCISSVFGAPAVPIVNLGYATYQGIIVQDTLTNQTNTNFLGVRYAAPPTGKHLPTHRALRLLLICSYCVTPTRRVEVPRGFSACLHSGSTDGRCTAGDLSSRRLRYCAHDSFQSWGILLVEHRRAGACFQFFWLRRS
jgi:hypothetical protein